MNEARKLNNRAVVEEQERLTEGVAYEKKRAKDELWGEKRAVQASLEAQGMSKDKAKYVFESATSAGVGKKRKGGEQVFGWDVFNEDSMYNAYFKRVKKFEKPPVAPKVEQPDRVQAMAQDLESQIAKRAEFRRERMSIEGEKDIDYINDRNKVFNEKLERNFGQYAKHIKANIESGNAV